MWALYGTVSNKKVLGGIMNGLFSVYGNGIIPTDFHSIIFQMGSEKPPTRKPSVTSQDLRDTTLKFGGETDKCTAWG